jgi:uncharacterized membrane protein
MPLDVTLSEEERDQWIARMAEEVARRRMEAPAVLFLELHRPLSFLSSQALIVAAPFLGVFVGPENVLKLSRILEDPKNIERLMDRIEEQAALRTGEGVGP